MSTYIPGCLSREEAMNLLTMQDVLTHAWAEAWPYPRWCKFWRDGAPAAIMVWLNGAYAKWFDIDPYAYIGHADEAVWPDSVAEEFRRNDLHAIEHSGEIINVTEPTPRGHHHAYPVRKFAFRVSKNEYQGWGIYGACVPD